MFCTDPQDAYIHIRIECEAEELSDIRQHDALESKNTRIGQERTTSVLPLPH